MEWRDQGVLLTVRPQGERDALIDVFTAQHGRRFGVVRGGASKKRAAELQPGAQLDVAWRARLETRLGTFRAEALDLRAARLMRAPSALAALSAAAALLATYLPEREPHPALYAETRALFDALAAPDRWPGLYAQWELSLLAALGFGLDLDSCAATGASQELIYVSPKSGRAVSRAAGAPYADRLLALPPILRLDGACGPDELAQAMRVTGHFLETWAAPALGRPPPNARARLVTRLAEQAGRPQR